MTTTERLVDQLRRSAEGDAWHGPSVREALEGVTVSDASAHPIPGAHSIRELVLHMAAGIQLVLRRLNGDGRQLTVRVRTSFGSTRLRFLQFDFQWVNIAADRLYLPEKFLGLIAVIGGVNGKFSSMNV